MPQRHTTVDLTKPKKWWSLLSKMGNDIWFKLANLLLNSSKCWIRYVIHGECTPIYQRGAPNSRHNHPNSLMFWKTDNSIRGLFHCPDVFITSQKSLGRWREPSKIWPRTSIIDLNLAKYPKHTVKKTETSKQNQADLYASPILSPIEKSFKAHLQWLPHHPGGEI